VKNQLVKFEKAFEEFSTRRTNATIPYECFKAGWEAAMNEQETPPIAPPAAEPPVFASTDDQRVTRNVMRHQYRQLTDAEKASMDKLKDKGLELYELIESLGVSRELALAKTKTEEAIMWAVKHLTR
jgi:hypothetical protein